MHYERRLSLASALLVLTVGMIGCESRNPVASEAPDPRSSFSNSAEERPTEPSRAGQHNTHYLLSTLATALGNSIAGAAQITGYSEHGGHLQVAIHTTVQEGFPTEGNAYLLVSSGDARTVWGGASYGCTGSGYCDVGGIDVSVAVPSNADSLMFDYRFFATDYLPYDDYFRAYLIAGGTVTQIASSSIGSEFGGGNGLRWGKTLRTVRIPVSSLRGQTVTLRFEAADKHDTAVPSGAAIDNLRFTPNSAVVTTVDVMTEHAGLVTHVNTLVSSGKLDRARGKSLQGRLKHVRSYATRALDATRKDRKVNAAAAVKQMEAFVKQVDGYVKSNRLKAPDAQPLKDRSALIILALQKI